MRLIILGSGPTKPVLGRGKNRRRNSSMLLIAKNGTTILFDCTPNFYEQMQTFANDVDHIDYIVLSHGHADAIGGLPQLKFWLKEKNQEKPPVVFMEEETENRVKERFKDLSFVKIKKFKPYHVLNLGYLKIVPFRVIHAEAFPTGHKFPCVGFRIDNKVVYAEDMEGVPEKSIPYFDNVDTAIIDAAMWFGKQIRGHMNVEKALDFIKKFKVKHVILTQAGHTYPDYSKASREIKKYWKEIGGRADVKLAYDGMKINIPDYFQKISDYLIEIREGIYLPAPHAELIWSGRKKYILKAKKYAKMIGKLLYLVDKDYAYGIIKLKEPFLINVKEEFDKYKPMHLVSHEERKKWWGGKRYLFLYPFDIIERFEKPRKIKIPQGVQTFVKNIKFLSELSQIELIEDITKYDPREVSNKVLTDDWRIVCAWYATKKRGEKFKYSLETIVNLAKIIYDEIQRRVKRGDMKHEFKPKEMTKYSRELYNMVSQGKILKSEDVAKERGDTEYTVDIEEVKPILKEFKEFKIIKDFISLVGSTVKREPGHKPNDIDLHIRMREPPDYIKRAIEVRILKMLPVDIANRIHFIWGDPEGSHDTFIPLYDLALVKSERKIVEMQELKVGQTIVINGKKGVIKEIV